MSRASLAPAAVLRAAAWPIEKLSGFGDAHLAEQAAAADPADQAGWRCYERAYGRAVAAERASLWSTTVDDRHFLKALTLANPAFAMRARQLKGRHSPARRIRRLEHTLYRYLARAVGRTEPCDLWAGVALISWSPVTIV